MTYGARLERPLQEIDRWGRQTTGQPVFSQQCDSSRLVTIIYSGLKKYLDVLNVSAKMQHLVTFIFMHKFQEKGLQTRAFY